MFKAKRIPSLRLHKPSGRAVVTINGRDEYCGRFGSPESQAEYERHIAELMSSRVAASASRPLASALTVVEVIRAFWEHARTHYRHPDGVPTEELGNIKAALRPVRELYGKAAVADFGPLALRAVRTKMVEAGLARSSINARVNRIRRVFRWAASVELVPVGVVVALETVDGLQEGRTAARETEPVEPVALEVVDRTLPYLSRPVAGLVRLQLLTGMRPGEACSMRGRDLKPGEPNWTYEPARHKTAWRGKKRVIPIGPKARALLTRFLTDDPGAHLFRPSDAVAEHHARRTLERKSRPTPSELSRRAAKPGARHAERYRRNSYLGAIGRACDRAFPHPTLSKLPAKGLTTDQAAELSAWRKLHRWHPNQLRHTVGTEVRARFGLEASQTVLGHARADVTQVYAARDLAKAHAVIGEIG